MKKLMVRVLIAAGFVAYLFRASRARAERVRTP